MTGASTPAPLPSLSWGQVAGILGVLLAVRLLIKGVSALTSMASREARYRADSGNWIRKLW